MKSSHITWLIVILIIVGAVIAVVVSKNKETETTQNEIMETSADPLTVSESSEAAINPEDIVFGQVIELERQEPVHISPSDEYEPHNSNPPSSGAHMAQTSGWGVYKRELNDLMAIHDLEHGGIWISYQPGLDEDMVKELKSVARQNPAATLMSPRSANPAPIAIVSWGRVMYLETPDTERIQNFIDSYKNDTHEPFAR